MKHFKHLALAATTAVALAPAAAHAATVDVQVEGASTALVATTLVQTTATPVNKDGVAGHDCTGTSVAGALEQATGGDWNGSWSSFGYAVERVRTESHPLGSNYQGKYFALYVNGVSADAGACGTELQDGDDVLLYVACGGATTGCYAGEPLFATAARTVEPGEALVVTVKEATTTYGPAPDYRVTKSLEPSAGASVNGTATRADGTATIVLEDRGPQQVVVVKGNRPPERVPVCVTDGADGFCGSGKPGATTAGAPSQAPAQDVLGVRSSSVVRARITSVRDGQVFPKGGGPAFLRGTVPATGRGIDRVRIRLTRNDRGRCFAVDGKLERQVRVRCGARNGRWIDLGDRAAWEYQVPFTTPRGRWVLDVQVRDRVGRVSRLERGNTRVVFTVR